MSIKVQQVQVSAVHDDIQSAFNDRTLVICSFCGKSSSMSSLSRELCEKLSSKNDIFCRFCLRHNLTSKNNRHTLILSFRSVFGYFYYAYCKAKKKQMYISEIKDYIRVHRSVGLTNPVFKYDSESFLWFIDFEKVGTTGRKIPILEVHRTIVNILSCFNFYETVPNFQMYKFYEKYKEAIDVFYTQRSRPEGNKILCPTFKNCGVFENKDIPFEKTREFTPKELVD